jgi:DNA-binding MarR family transcriptional regulator
MTQDTDALYMDIYNRLQKIHVQLDDGDRRTLAYFQITSPQYHALKHLYESEPVGLTITETADRLICTRGNATRLMKRMESQNLVHLNGDENDRRIVRATLTEEGRSLFLLAQDSHASSVKERFAALSDIDVNLLASLTKKLVDLLDWNLHG